MKDYREQNYYELLEISKYATQLEVTSSYQRACRHLHAESVATYSLFLPEELQLLRNRIEEAYRVLSNPESKKKYDRAILGFQSHPFQEELFDLGPQDNAQNQESPPSSNHQKAEVIQADEIESSEQENPEPNVEPIDPSVEQEAPQVDQPASNVSTPLSIDENTQYTGELFRKAREFKGLSLEKISEQTKITIFYLRCLEADQFADLPAKVYVRGYLKQFAKIIGLNPELAANGYLHRLE